MKILELSKQMAELGEVNHLYDSHVTVSLTSAAVVREEEVGRVIRLRSRQRQTGLLTSVVLTVSLKYVTSRPLQRSVQRNACLPRCKHMMDTSLMGPPLGVIVMAIK